MKYSDGSILSLGDIVSVPVPSGEARTRVVMLGEDHSHAEDIASDFLDWVTKEKTLEPTSTVVEWVDDNPFAHNDPRYAPVGKYMFCPLDQFVKRVE
jgi:hypothetical protein